MDWHTKRLEWADGEPVIKKLCASIDDRAFCHIITYLFEN